ncbi:cell division protein FtsQ/DivIB [uncultured Halopseudomonas sp.]|uniref:cell division protein FtsQ/DivIB n=1 Tax=uncultured Halopseudomonas sp. TaxID=2901193 RepID=UPI0030EDB223|tara:strand:+ start:912 stop:1778 length:867 start_codon:yes stop_codon:yes gene_type:complete
MLRQMVRDPRAGKTRTRRVAPGQGAVRVAPVAARSWPKLSLSRPSFDGALTRIKQVIWPLLLVGLGVGLYELGSRILPLADQPIELISVQGELQYIDPVAVQAVIQPYLNESFLGIDLNAMRGDLAEMPWVASAAVTRVWPSQLIIHLDEQLPVARWGDAALLNNAGKAFTPEDISQFAELPQLDGPQRAKQRVMQYYQQFNRLLRPYGQGVAKLELRERGSWFLTTQDGIQVLLGREELVDKVQRFLTIDQLMLAEYRPQIARVDLRYNNAMAVAWREPAVQQSIKE